MAYDPQNLLGSILEYYGELNETSLSRYNRARRRIRRGRYRPRDLLSDVLGFWMDATEGWLAAFNFATDGVPAVFFSVKQDQNAAPGRSIPLLPGVEVAHPTDLVRLGGPGASGVASIPKDKVIVRIRKNQGVIRTRLRDLRSNGDLDTGTYLGVIHEDDEALAMVTLLVA